MCTVSLRGGSSRKLFLILILSDFCFWGESSWTLELELHSQAEVWSSTRSHARTLSVFTCHQWGIFHRIQKEESTTTTHENSKPGPNEWEFPPRWCAHQEEWNWNCCRRIFTSCSRRRLGIRPSQPAKPTSSWATREQNSGKIIYFFSSFELFSSLFSALKFTFFFLISFLHKSS